MRLLHPLDAHQLLGQVVGRDAPVVTDHFPHHRHHLYQVHLTGGGGRGGGRSRSRVKDLEKVPACASTFSRRWACACTLIAAGLTRFVFIDVGVHGQLPGQVLGWLAAAQGWENSSPVQFICCSFWSPRLVGRHARLEKVASRLKTSCPLPHLRLGGRLPCHPHDSS